MSEMLRAVVLFVVYTFVIIVAFSVLDDPVTDVLTQISETASDMGISVGKDTLILIWHMIPAILLVGMLVWLLLWIHRVEPEEYYYYEEGEGE